MANKKVLIIAYYWPPSGGPGVQRWLNFVKYLPENGWKPIIYLPENPSYPTIDESLVAEVPENLTLLKTRIWEPYQIAEKLSKKNEKFKSGQFDVGKNQTWKSKLSIFIRGNLFIPDARKFWIKPSVRFLKKYLKKHPVDILITTGPPHSLHLIGLGLKNAFPKLKWIADFRDPWTAISYYKHLKLTSYANRRHHNLENKVLKNANLVLATSYTDAENFKEKGANSVPITNGFESREIPEKSPSDKFVLSYVGILEQLRNPSYLWEILKKLIGDFPEFEKSFELKFVGKIDDKILHDLENSVLKKHLNIKNYLPHEQSLNEMQNSDLLLLTNFPKEESKGIIPGKFFEYLQTKNPILSLGPKDADVEKILEETHCGKHFTSQDSDAIREYILSVFSSWKSGNSETTPQNIENYSRKNLTRKLSLLMDDLVK